ncbi:hypothetical protein FA13DRAFT_1717976 [Coprinellus micaceus]|uniref:Uncharacterized protein n=1 Tax=Coprinellus micaceus TaxID=71717 RepID=A0A4Y7SEK4_COPMI|nr:hypothetical protein FA13DRAFT_1717976 [Coprinellus micaceus]
MDASLCCIEASPPTPLCRHTVAESAEGQDKVVVLDAQSFMMPALCANIFIILGEPVNKPLRSSIPLNFESILHSIVPTLGVLHWLALLLQLVLVTHEKPSVASVTKWPGGGIQKECAAQVDRNEEKRIWRSKGLTGTKAFYSLARDVWTPNRPGERRRQQIHATKPLSFPSNSKRSYCPTSKVHDVHRVVRFSVVSPQKDLYDYTQLDAMRFYCRSRTSRYVSPDMGARLDHANTLQDAPWYPSGTPSALETSIRGPIPRRPGRVVFTERILWPPPPRLSIEALTDLANDRLGTSTTFSSCLKGAQQHIWLRRCPLKPTFKVQSPGGTTVGARPRPSPLLSFEARLCTWPVGSAPWSSIAIISTGLSIDVWVDWPTTAVPAIRLDLLFPTTFLMSVRGGDLPCTVRQKPHIEAAQARQPEANRWGTSNRKAERKTNSKCELADSSTSPLSKASLNYRNPMTRHARSEKHSRKEVYAQAYRGMVNFSANTTLSPSISPGSARPKSPGELFFPMLQ